MNYASLEKKLADGHLVVLDGGTGTELERRGVPMDADAWCGAIALEHRETFEAVHRDYITLGAEIITVNSFATSPLMLGAAGLADRFEMINRACRLRSARPRRSR